MTSALLSGTMTTLEAADYLGVSLATMKRWRGNESGPEYMQLSERIIRYRQNDLDNWLIRSKKNGR